MNKKNIFPVTDYNKFPEKFYFISIIKNIIKIADLKNSNKIILDYGCGNKIFSKILKNKKVINYDINPKYSECRTYHKKKFNLVIFNHVLMYLSKKQIKNLLSEIIDISPKCEMIIGLSKQNLLSKIGAFFLQQKAHSKTKSSYEEQLEVFSKKVEIIKVKKNIFGITDIYYGKSK